MKAARVGLAGDSVPLQPDDIHVWRVRTDVDPFVVHRLLPELSDDESERAMRLRAPRDRDRFIVRHAVLRLLLARYAHCEPGALTFVAGAHGKPRIATGPAFSIRFNVSQSSGVALVAFALQREVGVDVERLRDDIDCVAISGRFFAPEEAAAVRTLDAPERRAAFFMYWCCKEAWLKARGDGLSFPLDRCRIAWRPGEPPRLRLEDSDGQEQPWSLTVLDPEPGYAGAVVTTDGPIRLRMFDATLERPTRY
jgi:4'-phosphopantetheinyl transferase